MSRSNSEKMISEIVESFDRDWLAQNSEMYLDAIEENDVIEGFKSNYCSPSLGRIKHDDLDAEEILKKLGRSKLLKLIYENSEMVESDYYVEHNEMVSIQVGEVESQLDLEFYPDLAEELKREGKDCEGSILVYGNPCDRVILKLDSKAFLKAAAKILKQKAPISVLSDFKKPKSSFKPLLVSGSNLIQFKKRA